MRYLIAANLLLAALPFALQQCSGDTPVINEVNFPTEVTGNGLGVPGSVSWTDGNGGVQFAILASVVCPEGFECTGGTFDMLESDPEYTTYTAGRISFSMQCTNRTGADANFTWSWTLQDTEGHLSNTEEFAFVCYSAGPEEVGEGDSRIDIQAVPFEE